MIVIRKTEKITVNRRGVKGPLGLLRVDSLLAFKIIVITRISTYYACGLAKPGEEVSVNHAVGLDGMILQNVGAYNCKTEMIYKGETIISAESPIGCDAKNDSKLVPPGETITIKIFNPSAVPKRVSALATIIEQRVAYAYA